MPFFDDIDAIDERIDAKSSPTFITGIVTSVQPRYVRIRASGSSRSVNAYYNEAAPPSVGDKCMATLNPQQNKYVLMTAYQGQGSRSGVGNRLSEDFALAPPSNLAAVALPSAIVVTWDDPIAQSVAFDIQTNTSGVDAGATNYVVARSSVVIPTAVQLYVRVRSVSKDFRYSSWSDWVNATPTVLTSDYASLTDVDMTGIADGDVPIWDAGTSTWLPGPASSGGSLDDLSDVDTTTVAPTDGQALVWDSGTSTWVPETVGSGSFSGDAFDVPYTPTDSGDWSSVPTEVGMALDTLAADLAGVASLSYYCDYLTSAVNLTTANTYYDVLSRSLGAGTWLISATAISPLASGTEHYYAKLWDGTTVYASCQHSILGGGVGSLFMTGVVVVLASTTTVKLSAASASSSRSIQPTIFANNTGATNKGTVLTCIKIA